MPSPVGHSLASLTIGWSVARPATGRRLWLQAACFIAIGSAPDFDLLFGRHSGETHSIGAAAIAACVTALMRWPIADRRWRIALATFLIWFAHPLLDALAHDNLPPIGVMLFWPFTTAYFHSGLTIFAPISRRYWLTGFIRRNTMAILREIAILLPFSGIVWWLRKVQARRASGSSGSWGH